MKNFIAMSRTQAKRYTYKQNIEDYIIISISEPNEEAPKFNRTRHLKDVLHLYFEDISEVSETHITMSEQDCNDILNFIDRYKKVNNIIIHCLAGVSRSVSIKCALEEIYNNISIGVIPKKEKVSSSFTINIEEILNDKDDIVYIFNKLCYEKIKEIYKMRELIKKYRNNPILYAEEYLGIKLLSYQKVMLKMMNRKENKLK